MTAARVAVSFQTGERARRGQRERRVEELRVTHPPRVTLCLVRAHMIHDGIRTGEYTDYADAARTHGLTRARITQIMGLLLLAPDIQEDVLALRFPAGREPVTERHLRHVFGHPIWADQRREWRPIKKRGETEAADALRRAEAGR